MHQWSEQHFPQTEGQAVSTNMMDEHEMCVHAMQCDSLNEKGILTRAATWVSLEDFMLSDISQAQKDERCVTSLIRGPWRVRTTGTADGGSQGPGDGRE